MEQPFVEITSGDNKYQVYQITGRASCHLDRKVTDIAYSFKGQKMTALELGRNIIHSFANMEDYEFDELVEKTLFNVIMIGSEKNGGQNVKVTPENVYDIFKGDIDGLYGFLVKIWAEAYLLTPFKKAKAAITGA